MIRAAFVLFAFVGPLRADDWLVPAALKPGDRIAFVAPAGPADPERVAKAKQRIEKLGFEVSLPPALTARRDRYLAGSDDDRAAEFNAAIKDTSVKAVFAIKGGYGLTRVLDKLDYAAVRANPKIICGYSDLTALHLAVFKKCKLVTFHSPMPQSNLWRDGGGFDYSNDLFWTTLRAEKSPFAKLPFVVPMPDNRPKLTALVKGKARGRLVGGNLSLVAATVGTPYQIEAAGNILLLEDTGEKGYRVDRMLSQLKLAGLLDQFAGVLLGTFDGTDEKELEALQKEYFGTLKVPVLANFPVGHTPFNATLPHGGMIELDADAGTVRIVESPVTLK
jgi:muramoyltetrapeptide carboxypeptidase